jgi:hypothetical protein
MSEMMYNFQSQTVKQLRALLARRKIPLKGLKYKAQLVEAAQQSEVIKRKADEELEQENFKKTKHEHQNLVADVEARGITVSKPTLQKLLDAIHQDDLNKLQEEKHQKELEEARELWKQRREMIKKEMDAVWPRRF